MSYERIYNENDYHDHGVESDNDATTNTNIEMNNVDNWRLKTLYVDTKYVYAAKTDEVLTCDKLFAQRNRPQTHPSCLPVILKDSSKPYTYYTMKSYGDAQDHNYYVNFDDHVNGSAAAMPPAHSNHYNNNAFEMNDVESNSSVTFENSGCVKTYLCTLLGCFACCLFQMKPV